MCGTGQLFAGILALIAAACVVPIYAVAASPATPAPADGGDLATFGAEWFVTDFTRVKGFGPLFNNKSCVACHAFPSVGGMGPEGVAIAIRVGRLTSSGYDPMIGRGGPVARAHSLRETGDECASAAVGIPLGANVSSVRNAPPLFGLGLIDAIADADIIAAQRASGANGRLQKLTLPDGRERIGRFGWKGDTATLKQFVADAFRNELGMTNSLAPQELAPAPSPRKRGCANAATGVELSDSVLDAVTAYVAALPPPVEHPPTGPGGALFHETGCESCHRPSFSAQGRDVWLYSDLLVHDLGPALNDEIVQGAATGKDWRTTPLWGLGARPRFLHDGRARSVLDAVLAHGGEAAPAVQRFRALPAEQQSALLVFLAGL